MRRVTFQLYKAGPGGMSGAAINDSGGKVYVAKDGDAAKQAITNSAGTALTNPMSLTNGGAEFYVPDSVSLVDLYIMAPGGQFIVQKDVSGANDFLVDTNDLEQVAVIPFAIADTAAATETDTGFDLPTDSLVDPDVAVNVLTVDATETIDVGILSTESGGDADGFAKLVDVATAKMVPVAVTLTVGSSETYVASSTRGALLETLSAGSDLATDIGTAQEKRHRCDGTAKSISYTLTAGSDTAEGFIYLPYRLKVA